jgi:nucleotide-binding universal stress UspA family protein
MASRAAPGSAVPVHRVVVGIDGSDASDRALAWAATEAVRTGAVLEGHCSQGVGYLYTPRDEAQTASQKTIDEAADRVAEIAPGVTFKGVAHEGPAAKDLIDASEGADLLVVGSRGRGGFRGLLLGSVSQQCTLHARCPVVIVRSS